MYTMGCLGSKQQNDEMLAMLQQSKMNDLDTQFKHSPAVLLDVNDAKYVLRKIVCETTTYYYMMLEGESEKQNYIFTIHGYKNLISRLCLDIQNITPYKEPSVHLYDEEFVNRFLVARVKDDFFNHRLS